MSERRDDTTEPDERDAPPEPERAPRNYYYDDGTGYEVYDPAQDEDEPGDGDEAGSEAGSVDEPARDLETARQAARAQSRESVNSARVFLSPR